MTLPILRPGQTHDAVRKLKQALVQGLQELDQGSVAGLIRLDTKTYGPRTVNGVKQFQTDKQLGVDGVVGEKTWRALGFDEEVVDVRPPVLHGVPWEEGVIALDGKWVDRPLAEELLAQRRAGSWTGTVNSGYRPPWYQARLFTAAVAKYGSEAAAGKWVAPPGKSRHGKKGGEGAVDVTNGAQLDGSSERLYRPMSWEDWHVQLTGSRAMPGEEEEESDVDVSPPPAAELEADGVTMDDIDETIAVMLEKLDAQGEPPEGTVHIDNGYDPEATGQAG